MQVLKNSGHETKIRYTFWGSEHDSCFNAKSIWAYSKHKRNLNNRQKITKLDDNFFENVEQTKQNENKKLPCLQTIDRSHVPECRFFAVKFRAKWLKLLTSVLDDCAKTPDDELNW